MRAAQRLELEQDSWHGLAVGRGKMGLLGSVFSNILIVTRVLLNVPHSRHQNSWSPFLLPASANYEYKSVSAVPDSFVDLRETVLESCTAAVSKQVIEARVDGVRVVEDMQLDREMEAGVTPKVLKTRVKYILAILPACRTLLLVREMPTNHV
jgi:hypothetical protein